LIVIIIIVIIICGTEDVARIGERRNVYRILVGNPV